jgi:DNA-binding MarR family transcriptional regulator
MSSDPPVPVVTFQLILALAQQMRTLMDQRLRPDGLTTQQAALLTVVDTFGDPPTLSRVAAALSTSHQNARQIADALVRKGMLAYEADPSDARVRRLRTTTTNAAYWSRRNAADYDAVGAWFDDLTPGETRTLHALLTRVGQRVQRTLRSSDAPLSD